MDDTESESPTDAEARIRTTGPAEVTGQGREVFSFHLHRYLSGWLTETGCSRVMVTVGFDDSEAELGAFRIDRDGGHSVETGWTHRDLEDAWRFGDGRIVWEAPSGEAIEFEVVAAFDEPAADREPTSSDVLAFATVQSDQQLAPRDLDRLAEQVSTAVRVARRNGVRLFFEEQKDRPVKQLLYGMMDRLPEWSGCDRSASVLLTHDLDAMTLEDSTRGTFDVLAERLYRESDGDSTPDRLVGMRVRADEGDPTILADALARYHPSDETSYFVYRFDDDQKAWRPVDARGDTELLSGWYQLEDRPGGRTVAFVPLTAEGDRDDQRDLLGFLAIGWSDHPGLPPSIDEVLEGVGTNLGRLLRHSPLYTLSVRKLWVVRQVRDRIEGAVQSMGDHDRPLSQLVETVTELVAEHVDIPSFAIGVLEGEPGDRMLRYEHPHGWTRYERLDLEVDVPPDERIDSGISALAVRLGRPVVLAGGQGEGADQEFKNHLWVDEKAGELFDARHVDRTPDADDPDRRPLRDYYKPARESAYASLAYPMVFAQTPVGVLTVEVERSTDWLWWTGFGGHLFWDMIAREMAMGIYELR